MKDIRKFINNFNDLNMDKLYQVELLSSYFKRWVDWNKANVRIDILGSDEFDIIVVVHDFFDDVSIVDSWKFLEDVKYCLTEYVMNEVDNKELHNLYYDDVVDFWSKFFDGDLSVFR